MNAGFRQTLWKTSSAIPSSFKVLEFVNANGSQWSGDAKPLNNSAYINTGILPSTNLRILTTIIKDSAESGWQAYIGSNPYSLYSWPLMAIRTSVNASFCKSTNYELAISIASQELNIEYDARRLKVNDQVSTRSDVTDYTETENYPLIIGGMYQYTSSIGARGGASALYKRTTFVNLQTNEVLGDFIPVKDKSTLICGFYDIMKKQFHSSLNNIPFTENGFS